MIFRNVFLAGVVAALTATAPAAAAVIFSENFSGGTLGTQTVPGWTLSPLTNSILVLDSAAYRACCGSGDTGTGQFIAFSAGNSPPVGIATSPTLALVAGRSYTLAFDYGVFGSQPQALEVLFNATSLGTVNLASGTTFLPDVLKPFSFAFTASGPGTLSFIDRSRVTDSVDSFLDNVTVSAGVPEPSTWAMMLIGFAGLAYAARRRVSNAVRGKNCTNWGKAG